MMDEKSEFHDIVVRLHTEWEKRAKFSSALLSSAIDGPISDADLAALMSGALLRVCADEIGRACKRIEKLEKRLRDDEDRFDVVYDDMGPDYD